MISFVCASVISRFFMGSSMSVTICDLILDSLTWSLVSCVGKILVRFRFVVLMWLITIRMLSVIRLGVIAVVTVTISSCMLHVSVCVYVLVCSSTVSLCSSVVAVAVVMKMMMIICKNYENNMLFFLKYMIGFDVNVADLYVLRPLYITRTNIL